MQYYFSKTLNNVSFDEAVAKVTEELKKEGFGVISEINLHEKFKEKLDIDFRKYRILGACNPASAFKALQQEDKIGTMLPCNVIVQQLSDAQIEVAAVDPVASMQAIENANLAAIANEIRSKLEKVIENI
jgi:uncharacterized protein (DUF302 family)